MNTPIDDGGPAFPRTESRDSCGPANIQDRCAKIVSVGGMSLRDWFAGQALASMETTTLIAEAAAQQEVTLVPGHVAELCYHIADAMLAERQKGKQ